MAGAADERGVLPRAAVLRLMKKAGRFRLERGAVAELHAFLEATAKETAKRAGVLARYAKRKTVSREDVSLGATE